MCRQNVNALDLQVTNTATMRVLLGFGLLSDENIGLLKEIDLLLRQGSMSLGSVYKVVKPKAATKTNTSTPNAGAASSTSSPAASRKRAASPAQNAGRRHTKPKTSVKCDDGSKQQKKQKVVNSRAPASNGGGSPSGSCCLIFVVGSCQAATDICRGASKDQSNK